MMRIFCQNLVVPLFLTFIGFEENDQGRYFPGRFVTLAAIRVFASAVKAVFKFSVVWLPSIIGTVFFSILLCLTANRISAVVNARL
jgi:hypothetical protein